MNKSCPIFEKKLAQKLLENPAKHTVANFHKDCTGKSKVSRRGLTTNILS